MDILSHNRLAWDRNVDTGNTWTVPVDAETILRARSGDFTVVLTPTKPVPKEWFPDLADLPTLCLASGGGQQGPLLAAAGADVTVFDNSPRQLAQDRLVADRDGLALKTLQGDMADLSVFPSEHFGLIFHPCSNCFVPDVLPVWRECFRVLKRGGVLMAGFNNSVRYLFEDERLRNGVLTVRYAIPTSDVDNLNDPQIHALIVGKSEALEFGHALADQIGGQLAAGFVINGFFEDRLADASADPLSNYIDSFIATRSVKP